MRARADAATLLERALTADALAADIAIAVGAATATRWASATFVGARHRLRVEGTDGAGVGAWIERLAEAELPLRGHLVADLVVEQWSRGDGRFAATIEALTVEDG